MLVEIDEAGCNDEAAGIDGRLPAQDLCTDRPDRPAGNADVAHGI